MDGIRPTSEQLSARRKRSQAIAWALVGFMGLVFLVTVASLRQNAVLPGMRWENQAP